MFLGKRVIQTNPSRFDERLGGGGGGDKLKTNSSATKKNQVGGRGWGAVVGGGDGGGGSQQRQQQQKPPSYCRLSRQIQIQTNFLRRAHAVTHELCTLFTLAVIIYFLNNCFTFSVTGLRERAVS